VAYDLGSSIHHEDAYSAVQCQVDEHNQACVQQTQDQQNLEGLSDSHIDPDVVPGVETGEDVVAYYGVNGQDSPVKFFYCTRWAA
jgi:dynein heavy chain